GMIIDQHLLSHSIRSFEAYPLKEVEPVTMGEFSSILSFLFSCFFCTDTRDPVESILTAMKFCHLVSLSAIFFCLAMTFLLPRPVSKDSMFVLIRSTCTWSISEIRTRV